MDHFTDFSLGWFSHLEIKVEEKAQIMSSLKVLDKNVVVVGLGLTGLSCVRFLAAKGAKVSAMDSRKELSIAIDVPLYLGEFDPLVLCKADLLVLSPGIDLAHPVIQIALNAGVRVIGDIELFACFNHTPLIVITGSNGKSTVTSIVAEMFQAAGKKVFLGGNIGIPALDILDQEADMIVLELSSFQLETTFSLKPLVATLLNLSDDHLDRHGDSETYGKIKQKIYQGARYKVCNRDQASTYPRNDQADLMFGLSACEQGFSWSEQDKSILFDGHCFIQSKDCLLVGAHNMLNIQAAAAVSLLAGLSLDAIKQGAMSFGGLAHRCQTVSMYNNVRWINDSKATNVGATVAAIQGLRGTCQGKLILIAGGEGKGADFSSLRDILNSSVDVLITLGKDGDQIAQLKAGSLLVASLEQAVQEAAKLASAQDTVLLSPACASVDMFVNYQQRGDCFSKAVGVLAA
ncbi:MAG: UDP-N-acetylmuramoylalanine--D-glutamate ligase [Paraglaciecola sp.]